MSASIVCGLIFSGCAANVAHATPATASASASSATPIRESFQALSEAQLEKSALAFERQNPGWSVTRVKPNVRGDLFVPDIFGAARTTFGPLAMPTAASAEAKARAFVMKNASFLGLTQSEAASLVANVNPERTSAQNPNHSAFLVGLTKQSSFPGYEAFPQLRRAQGAVFRVLDDGEVGSFGAVAYSLPTPHIRTTPRIAPTDTATITAKVIGHPLYRYEEVAPIPNTYGMSYRRHPDGVVEKDAIKDIKLIVQVDRSVPQTVSYALVYEVKVERAGGDRHVFLVNPDTGTVVLPPQWTLGPIVP